jgi:hypothetical protein
MFYSLTINIKCSGHVSFQHSHHLHLHNYLISGRNGNPTPVNAPACSGKYCLAKIMPEGTDRNNTWRSCAVSEWERKGRNNGVQGPLGCRTDTISRLAWPCVRYWDWERCMDAVSVNYTHPVVWHVPNIRGLAGIGSTPVFWRLIVIQRIHPILPNVIVWRGKLAQTIMLLTFIRKVPG